MNPITTANAATRIKTITTAGIVKPSHREIKLLPIPLP
jgi:hypothetical protein